MPHHCFRGLAGRMETLWITSPAIGGNLLGDPPARAIHVYLPPGYDTSTEQYPLFVELAGFTGSGLGRTAWKGFGENTPQRLERLAAEGKMGPVIAAFPDCFTSLGGNQYINSIAMGRWADFLTIDLVSAIEQSFRVRRGRSHRALFGKSSGGYGALVHGMKYADHWGAVASHSGDAGFEWVYRPFLPEALNTIAACGGSITGVLDAFYAAPKVDNHILTTIVTFAMAASYDPDPTAPFGIRLPVDPWTCELIPERWAAWLSHDPVLMVETADAQENLRKLSGIFVDCGGRDQYQIHFGTRQWVQALRTHQIDHVYEEFADNHSNVDYRLDHSLPYLYHKTS